MVRPVARHLLPASAAVLFVLPLWFMLAGSLRSAGLPPPTGVELLPSEPTLQAYRDLPRLLPLTDYLRNSAVVVTLAVPLTVLVASWAGYGIRLLPRRGQRAAVAISLAVMTVPPSALWATRFEVYRGTGLLGTLGALVAPALLATTPFYALIYAWSFAGVPDSQLQAGRLEGASQWRIWRSLAMPQARPATLAVAVLAFTFHWGNFLDALLYLRGQESFTLPLGLQTLLLLNPTQFPLLMAAALLYTLPSVGVFLLAQRLFLDDPLRGLRPRRSSA